MFMINMPTVDNNTTPVTENEIKEFFKDIMKTYNWSLIARMGHGDKTDETYDYLYIDDLGISITLNPNNKGFQFMISVDFVFKLKSDEFTPWDYKRSENGKTHFETFYERFRRNVVEKQIK